MRSDHAVFAAAMLIGVTACTSLQPEGAARYMAPDFKPPDTVHVLPYRSDGIWSEDARQLAVEFIDSLRKSGRLASVRYDSAPASEVTGLVRYLGRLRDGLRDPDSARVSRLAELVGARYLLYVNIERFESSDQHPRLVQFTVELWDGPAGRVAWCGSARESSDEFQVASWLTVGGRDDEELGRAAYRVVLAGLFATPRFVRKSNF